MSRISQSGSGKAWEYSVARSFSESLEVPIVENSIFFSALRAYQKLSSMERGKRERAACKAVSFLTEKETRLKNLEKVELQGDQRGGEGDVRDVLLVISDGTKIGLSMKNRHRAIKHSRLSSTIDFGKEWYALPCSQKYWEAVGPIFLRLKDKQGEAWSCHWDQESKHRNIYQLILRAFMEEIGRCATPNKLMEYLLGKYDYYKIIKENGHVKIQSYNMYGNLFWGKKLTLPTRIIEIKPKERSQTTVELTMDKGWQLSFRIHNASGRIEPSLNFDINLIGHPQNLSSVELSID